MIVTEHVSIFNKVIKNDNLFLKTTEIVNFFEIV